MVKENNIIISPYKLNPEYRINKFLTSKYVQPTAFLRWFGKNVCLIKRKYCNRQGAWTLEVNLVNLT